MKSILHLISSPRGDASISIKLGRAIVNQLQQKYPGSNVKEVNLAAQDVPHLDASHLQSFFTPEVQQSNADHEAIKFLMKPLIS